MKTDMIVDFDFKIYPPQVVMYPFFAVRPLPAAQEQMQEELLTLQDQLLPGGAGKGNIKTTT